MSQRKRLGLSDLAGLRKPLVQSAVPDDKPAAPSELPSTVPLSIPPEVPPTVPAAVLPRILQERHEKKRLVSQSFKLPADLDERWSRIAAFNKVTKTGILLEALETFLDRLPEPPPTHSK
jgi:hypothetical protein